MDTYEKLTEQASLWLMENGMEYAMKIVGALIVLFIARIVIRIVGTLIEKGLDRNKGLNDLLKRFLIGLAKKTLWVFTWVIVLSQLGIEVGPLIAGLGVAGFIVGFACQDSLGNFAAGLMILANNPFRNGDYVEVGGHAGSVKDLNVMATTLTTPDNKQITIPNKLVWGASIINYTITGTRRVDMTVGISYDSDIARAKEILMSLLKADERVLDEPEPMVEVLEMADSSVNFVVRPWSKTEDYWSLFFDMQHRIKNAFDEAGIEIPFPQRVVHMVQSPPAA